MKKYYTMLQDVKLFSGIDESAYEETLTCLNAKVTEYKKGRIIQIPGDNIHSIGIVLNGCIEISRTDFAGNRLIVKNVEYPDMFGEALIFAGVDKSPLTIIALENSTILKLDIRNIISNSGSACPFYRTITTNMFRLIAAKNLFLSSRLEIVTKKTIRAKLSGYLLQIAESAKSMEFEIPFNRGQLAEFLNADRSALSKVLSKLQQDGILDFKKNKFILHKPEKISGKANGI